MQFKLSNPIPRAFKSSTMRTRSERLRPSLSSRQTTKVSPARKAARHSSSLGRADDLPLAFSSKTRSHLATFSASRWRSRF